MSALLALTVALAQQHAPLDLLQAVQDHFKLVFHGPSACGCDATCADPDCGDCACAACEPAAADPPEEQLMVIHGLRVVQARGVGTLADTTDRLGGDNGLLVAATDLLRGGGEDDTGCCVRLELADLDEAAPDDAEAADGSPLFTADLIGGQKQLNRIHAALAARGQTAFYARSLLGPNRAGTQLGQADAATGTMAVERGAGPSTWAHELGHLQGLGHLVGAAQSGQVMYRYGDVANQAGGLSCRDCDFFRASAPDRGTISTVVSHERCATELVDGLPEGRGGEAGAPGQPSRRGATLTCQATIGADSRGPHVQLGLLVLAALLVIRTWGRAGMRGRGRGRRPMTNQGTLALVLSCLQVGCEEASLLDAADAGSPAGDATAARFDASNLDAATELVAQAELWEETFEPTIRTVRVKIWNVRSGQLFAALTAEEAGALIGTAAVEPESLNAVYSQCPIANRLAFRLESLGFVDVPPECVEPAVGAPEPSYPFSAAICNEFFFGGTSPGINPELRRARALGGRLDRSGPRYLHVVLVREFHQRFGLWLGGVASFNPGNTIVVSESRYRDDRSGFLRTLAHEVGHALGGYPHGAPHSALSHVRHPSPLCPSRADPADRHVMCDGGSGELIDDRTCAHWWATIDERIFLTNFNEICDGEDNNLDGAIDEGLDDDCDNGS